MQFTASLSVENDLKSAFWTLFCLFLSPKSETMLERTRGVVLRVLRYKEDALIADIYTERHGTVAFVVKVPKSRKASLHTQLLRPLHILELDFEMRPNQAMQRIKEMRLAVAYSSLPYDPVKSSIAFFLAEVLSHALRHEASNPPLLEFLQVSLQWLDLADGNVSNFHLVFLIQLTRHLGFWPDVESVDGSHYFDLQEGASREEPPLRGGFLTPQEAVWLPIFARLRYGSMHLIHLSREQRAHVVDLIVHYYRLHVAEFPELKSLGVLADLLR